jgi:hypothetical protein
MSDFSIYKSKLVIKASDIHKIFVLKEKKISSFNRLNYQNTICEEFQRQFSSTVNIKDTRINKAVTIRLYCCSASCDRQFKLKLKCCDLASEEEDVQFDVYSTKNVCTHQEKIVRRLMKGERERVVEEIQKSSVTKYRNDSIRNSDKELLSEGHMQKIYSEDVLRKAVSEKKCEKDLDKDHLIDLFLRRKNLNFVTSMEFLKDSFNVCLISEKQISALKLIIEKKRDKKEVSRIYYDATGSICEKPDETMKVTFHYVIIAPHLIGSDDRHTMINVGEMITSSHTADQQELFLRKFLHAATKDTKNKGLKEYYKNFYLVSVQYFFFSHSGRDSN